VARRRRALAGQDLRGDRQPRAAPPSQPWATICCAFGVEGRYQPPGWNVFVPRASSPSSGCPRAPNGAGDTSPERKPWVITPELTVPSTGLAQPERRAPEGMRGNRSRVERRGMAWEGRWSRGRDRSSAWNCRGRPSVPRHLDTATPNTDRHAQPEAWSGRGGAPPPPRRAPGRPPPPPPHHGAQRRDRFGHRSGMRVARFPLPDRCISCKVWHLCKALWQVRRLWGIADPG
jgi:hypothetical protein